jgi:hypothetical protein
MIVQSVRQALELLIVEELLDPAEKGFGGDGSRRSRRRPKGPSRRSPMPKKGKSQACQAAALRSWAQAQSGRANGPGRHRTIAAVETSALQRKIFPSLSFRHGALSRRTTDAIAHWRLASGGYRLASILQCSNQFPCASQEKPMFGIDWLREGVPVDKEASVLTNEAEVVAGARARARAVIDRHPGREPDSFRLTDVSGKIFGVFPIDQRQRPREVQVVRAKAAVVNGDPRSLTKIKGDDGLSR